MTRRPARTARGLAAAVALTLLAGCGGEGARTAVAPRDPGPHPVVAAPQAARILEAVDRAQIAAEAARDASLLGARGGQPYTTMAAAGFTISKKLRPTQQPARRGPVRTIRTYVPTQDGWPRFLVSVGQLETQSTPTVRLLRSPDPRAPYALSADMLMFPGADLPAGPGVEVVPVVAPTSADVPIPPREVVARYADVLTRGSASQWSRLFADDVLRRQLDERLAGTRSGLSSVATVTSSHAPVPESVVAVALADGSTLVVGELTQTLTITVRPGAGTVTATPDLAALAGVSVFRRALTRTSSEVVTFVVRPGEPVAAIAAQREDVKVTGS